MQWPAPICCWLISTLWFRCISGWQSLPLRYNGHGGGFRVRTAHWRMLGESLESSAEAVSWQAPQHEIDRRRNFAIISHPDAGKTTLTEKLLLFGGAIQEAGAVKARAEQRKATSDWMEIEKQRGISVTSTVLTFEYAPPPSSPSPAIDESSSPHQQIYKINLLDTPGHQDFSEDTYRTLTAADNCVMLLDGAKGIEERTRKLYEVCKLRQLPIFTFVNKLDRPSKSPLSLLDDIEREFSLQCVAMNWPIGSGTDFQGVYDRATRMVLLFQRGDRRKKTLSQKIPLEDAASAIGEDVYRQLMEDIDMLDAVMPPLNQTQLLLGEQTPVYFGSAMNSFGVELFLHGLLSLAQPPAARYASLTTSQNSGTLVPIAASDNIFSGFVFKLQTNLDPKHRDRMAFLRICSGTFDKGMKVYHSRLKKIISLSSAQSLFAQDRQSVQTAYPGDVIGIHNPGHFAIGDSICSSSSSSMRISFPGIPSFSPERFAYIRNPQPSMAKKFQKGLQELLEEGAVQLLRHADDAGNGIPLMAAVGQLQLDVLHYRLKAEYGIESILEPILYEIARWVQGGWEAVRKADEQNKLLNVLQCQDRWGRPVLLFRNMWKVQMLQDEAAGLELVPWAMPPSHG